MTDTPTLTLSYSSVLLAATNVFAFDGNASISQSNVSNFPVGGFTLSCWLQTAAGATGGVIVSYDSSPTNANRLWIKNVENVVVGFGANSTGNTGVAVNDGQWHQLAVTMAPSDSAHYAVAVYLDGVLEFYGAGAIARTTSFETGATLVLGQGISGESGLVAKMSEFRLWNGVQSAAEIMTTLQTRMPSDPNAVIYWQLTSSATAGTINGGSFVAGTLQFRTQQFNASWTTVAGATYNLEVWSADNTQQFSWTSLTATQQSITGFTVNTQYLGKVQAVVSGVPSPWSSNATATLLDLGVPVVGITAPTPVTLSASWPAIDQAQGYEALLYKNGSITPSTTPLTQPSYDLTSIATGADTYNFQFLADSESSSGPASAMTTAPAVTLTFNYLVAQTGGTLQLSWTAPPTPLYYYVSITLAGQNDPVYAAFVTSTSYQITSGLAEGQVYTANVRAITAGSIGVFATAQVTIHNFGFFAPTITGVTATQTAPNNTAVVSWTFGITLPNDTTYNAALLQNGNVIATQNVAASPATFVNSAIVNGATLAAEVRATADGSIGLWSAQWTFVVGGPPQVQNVTALVNSSNDVQVNWSAVTGVSGVTYTASITGNGVNVSHTSLTGTTTTFTQSETNVQPGLTYTVAVSAVANGVTGPAGTTSVKIEQTNVNPPDQDDNPWWSDPINASAGSYAYSRVDLFLNSLVPLTFVTAYNSATPSSSENPLYTGQPLGNRWNHSYNTKLVKINNNTQIACLWGDNRVDIYTIPSTLPGNYPIVGIPNGSTLVSGFNGNYTLTTKQQYQYTFNPAGALTTIIAPSGNVLNLSYSGGLLQTVSDPVSGHRFTLSYNNGYLTAVADDSGRSITISVVSNQLMWIKDVQNNPRSFTYTGDALLKTITDEDGNVIVTNTWTGNQVTFQQDARAVASHQSYGSALAYTNQTINGVPMVVTNATDREGNTVVFNSIAANGVMTSANYALANSSVRMITETYDGVNNPLTVTLYEGPSANYTNGKGNTNSYTYDGNSNVLTVTDPLGRVMTYTYDSLNNVTSVTDFDGNTTAYGYTGTLLQSINPPLGGATTITYWPGAVPGLFKTVTDGYGNVTNYEYTNGYLTMITDPLQQKTTISWNDAGLPHVVTAFDSSGNVVRTTTYTYWSPGWVKSISIQYAGQSAADAYVWNMTYDNTGNLQTRRDPTGNTVTYGFDPNGLLDSILYPPFAGVTRNPQLSYDRIDFVNGVISSQSNPTVIGTYANDIFGRPVRYTDPNQNVYTYSYGMLDTTAASGPYQQQVATSYPLLSGDPATYSEVVTYDAAGRPVAVTDRGGNVTNITYATNLDHVTNTYQSVVTVTLPPVSGGTRYTIVLTYDALGRIIARRDERGKITTWAYSTATDPVSHTTQTVTTITDPVNNQIINTYDALRRLVGAQQGTAAEGTSRTFQYDALGRIVKAVELIGTGNSVTTNYTYTFNGTTKLIDATIGTPGSATNAYVQHYNGAYQLTGETDALGNNTSWTYTTWNALATFTNGRGQQFAYGFDAAGRLLTTTLPSSGGVVAQTLDANGNRKNTQLGSNAPIVRTFDTWNRLLSRTDAANNSIGYGYWPTNQLKVLTYSDSKTVQYFIDGLQRLDHLIDWSNRTTTYRYYPTGQVESIALPNGVTTSVTLNDAGNQTGIAHTTASNIIARIVLQLDSVGRPSSGTSLMPIAPVFPSSAPAITYGTVDQILTVGGQQISSDNDGDLLGLPSGSALQTVGYDAYGNVSSIGNVTYGYDPDGYLTTRAAGSSQTYVRDVQLYQSPWVERADPVRSIRGGVGTQTPFSVSSIAPLYGVSDVEVPFSSALDRLLEIEDGSGSIVSRFLYGAGLLAMEDGSGNIVYAHSDTAGSTIALTGSDGTVTDRWSLDPFGNALARSGATTMPFVFDGRDGLFDDGTGLLWSRSRSYAPSLMRFMQRDYLMGDPRFPQSVNRYAYALDTPMTMVDPLALALKDTAIAVGALAVLGLIVFGISRLVPPPIPPVPPVAAPPPPAQRPGFEQGSESEREPLIEDDPNAIELEELQTQSNASSSSSIAEQTGMRFRGSGSAEDASLNSIKQILQEGKKNV